MSLEFRGKASARNKNLGEVRNVDDLSNTMRLDYISQEVSI